MKKFFLAIAEGLAAIFIYNLIWGIFFHGWARLPDPWSGIANLVGYLIGMTTALLVYKS